MHKSPLNPNTLNTLSEEIAKSDLEKAFIASETRYRRLFESAKDGILILDAETGKIVDVNPFLIDLLGFTKQNFKEKSIWEIGSFKDIYENKEKFLELQQNEYVRYDDLPLETAIGRKISVEFISNSYFEENKKVIQCNIRETTTRKQSELALRKSESQLRTLVKTIPDLVWLKDTNGVYLSCNQMFELFFGAKETDIIGKTDYDFVDRELADFFRENDRTAMEAGKPTSNEEWVTFADDGHRAFLDTIKTPIYDSDGTLLGILGIGRDITERKKSEDTLFESEIKYRTFFENSMDAIFLTSPEGKILSANQASCNMFGYSEDELIRLGKSGIVDCSDPRLSVLLDERNLQGKARGEVTFLRKDRTRFPAEISLAIFKNHLGLQRSSIIIRDITESKQTAEALRKSEQVYRSLFENMLNGFAYCKLIFEDGRPQDFVYLAVNKSFEVQTGLKDVIGKKVSDVIPGIRKSDPNMFELYGRVALTGKPETIEIYVEALKMWFSMAVYSPGKEHFVSTFDVITKRKNAEEVLRQSEAKFRKLINSLPDSVFVVDTHGRIVYCNENAVKTFDYTIDEIHHCTIEDLIPKPFRKQHITLRNEYISEPKSRAMGEGKALFAQRKGGSEFPTEVMLEPVEINGNQFTLAIVRDISERKKIENEIKFQANLLNNVGQSVIATDLPGKVIYWNNAAEKIYGWSPSEAIGESIMDLIQPSEEQATDIMKTLSAGNTWAGEFGVKRKDGSSFPAFGTNTPIFDSNGKLNGFLGISQDITERKQILQKIKESEEKFRIITENSADAIFITDKEGKYIYVNQQAVDLLGYSKEEFFTFTIADIVPKNKIEEYIQTFQQFFITGNSYSELELVKKDGSHAETDLNAVMLPNGWIYGSCRDISKRKQLEIDLIKAKEKAEESDRLKTAFLTNISHEIRTPLNGVLGFTELIRTEGLKVEEQQQFIVHIEKSGIRLLNLLNDIISFSIIESQQTKVSVTETNINEHVEHIYYSFKLAAEQKDLHISFKNELTSDKAFIRTDKEKLFVVLTNLVKNAIKFTQTGSVELGYAVKDDFVEFYVKDSGTGISDEQKIFIFERFRQGSDSLTRNYEGAGLGLSISKAYVEMLGGKIWVEDNTGKNGYDRGCTFFFTIPFAHVRKRTLIHYEI